MSDGFSHADYNLVLKARNEFEGRPLERLRLSNLNCPTGRLIVTDPLACPEMPVFARAVAPGSYPVDLYIVKTGYSGYRVALAVVTFSNRRAVRWPMALKPGESIDELSEPGDFFGFPVDAGLACIVDERTHRRYMEFLNSNWGQDSNWNSWDDYFAPRFLPNARDPDDPRDIGDWLDYHLPEAPGHNMAMFATGMGDGVYPSYWGEDSNGALTHLVIDFHVVLLPDK